VNVAVCRAAETFTCHLVPLILARTFRESARVI